jgi:hypothetical protein
MRMGRGALLTLCLTVMCASAALAATPGVYVSKAPNMKRPRWAEINLQVLKGGQRVNWDFWAVGPCTLAGNGISAAAGTDAGSIPPDPQIHLRHGQFRIARHGISPSYWAYTFQGHVTALGFAGTLRFTEHWGSGRRYVRCDTGVMHWSARPSRGPFR